MKSIQIAVLLGVVALVAACGGRNAGNGTVLNLRASAVPPDEFLVVPQNPLEMPADLASLPAPTPGSTDRVQIDSEAQLLAALGGRRIGDGGVPADDAALVAAARSGTGGTENIREILQAEDAAFRADRESRIAKLAKDNNAVQIYARMLLNAQAELARLRALGVRTPTAPVQ